MDQAEYDAEVVKLQAYRDKVLGDLDQSRAEADAVHDAAEKKMDAIDAQKATVLAEYDARYAAIPVPEAPSPPPPPEGSGDPQSYAGSWRS